jgi:hypothetical protein
LPTLAKLPTGHLFRDAISALIDSLMAGEFDHAGKRYGSVRVTFRGPTPSASVLVELERRALLLYHETADPLDSYRDEGDLTQARAFTIETLSKIARVIGTKENAAKLS